MFLAFEDSGEAGLVMNLLFYRILKLQQKVYKELFCQSVVIAEFINVISASKKWQLHKIRMKKCLYVEWWVILSQPKIKCLYKRQNIINIVFELYFWFSTKLEVPNLKYRCKPSLRLSKPNHFPFKECENLHSFLVLHTSDLYVPLCCLLHFRMFTKAYSDFHSSIRLGTKRGRCKTRSSIFWNAQLLKLYIM